MRITKRNGLRLQFYGFSTGDFYIATTAPVPEGGTSTTCLHLEEGEAAALFFSLQRHFNRPAASEGFTNVAKPNGELA